MDDRRDALGVAGSVSGRPVHLLEKDVWVVWALETLFTSEFGHAIVFKGGTSLSKAYQVIRRFSEDVDLTYDIRSMAPDLIEDDKAIPPTRSQEKRWSDIIRSRLPVWTKEAVLPIIRERLEEVRVNASANAESDKIYIEYEPIAQVSAYVHPRVILEFGARSTGEPWVERQIVCDAAVHLPAVAFPEVSVRTMRAERTFWEKATAIHVFCLQEHPEGANRYARHWHDIARMDDAGYATAAISDRALAREVAQHKAMFFREKDKNRQNISYKAAVNGALRLVPEGGTLEVLREDYRQMVEDGLLLESTESFDTLVERCREIQSRANEARTHTTKTAMDLSDLAEP